MQTGNAPLELKDRVIYFVGPTPARPGEVIVSADPTTFYRTDATSPALTEQSQTGMIGKGNNHYETGRAACLATKD